MGLQLDESDRATLEAWVAAHGSAQAVVRRSRIVLMSADGASNSRIAREVGVSRPTVLLWQGRFEEEGVAGLTHVAPGRGRRPTASARKTAKVVDLTLHSRPKGATNWTCRSMAGHVGLSPATVQRIWDAHGLQPHRTETFKLSQDKRFLEKLTDIVGLYLDPPDRAVVLCVDEKSQIQALDRTQPGLPMKKGRCGTMTHDYRRHGTATLFAAMNTLDGKVIGQCEARHRNGEFLSFLRRLDREFPNNLPLHLVLDNYGTHKHPNVREWLENHPRFHLHFTPTSSSWLNLIERWFRDLTVRRIRRGSFVSVKELKGAIYEYIQVHNSSPKPFVWTATVESIMAKLKRCKVISETLH